MVRSAGRVEVDPAAGASLVLALIFLTVVSLISMALASWTATGLRSTVNFTAAQSTVSTANSVAELALQEVRYNFYSNSVWVQVPVSCWPSGSTPSALQGINNQNMYAYCSTHWNPSSVSATRKVTVYVCPSSLSATSCAATPYLQVIATFDDFPVSGGNSTCVADVPTEWTSCGTYMTINSWVYATNPPTLTSFVQTGASPSCGSTNSFSVYGTGFVSGTTNVYFVSRVQTIQNGIVVSTTLQVLKGTGIVVTNSSGTVATGCLPAGLTGSQSISVSTPVGQSSQVVSATF